MSAMMALQPTLEPECDPRGLGALVALTGGVEVALPLTRVQVRAEIVGGCARTVVEQHYTNALSTPVEAVHIFPLPPAGALIDVVLRCGDLEVRADLKEKGEAQATFAAAREAGHRAALVTQARDDVHTLRVTRLPPGEGVTVRLEVVEFLDFVDGAWRYRFPTTIAPRYLPGNPVGQAGDGILPDTDQVPDASWLQPPLRLAGGTRLDLEVLVRGPVHGVESAQHAVSMRLEGGDLRLAPSGKASLDRDIVFAVVPGDGAGIEARGYTDGKHAVVQVAPPATGAPDALPRDAVFVVDISGSMDGTKMEAAKAALTAALHGLLPGDRFALIAFDDRLEHFSPELVAYDARSLAKADQWVSRLAARGGTEMLPAIKAALTGETPAGRLRTVLFITDGQAWNTQELVAAVSNRRGRSLFFTLGIDTAVNDALLKQLARVGGGTCELATPNDDIEAVVARLEARFGAPLATELRVVGRDDAAMQAAVLFAGRPAVILVEGDADTLTVNGEGSGLPVTVPLRKVDFPLGALWGRRRIAALEDRLILKPFEEEALRPELIRVSLANRVGCRFTAFVAVETSRVVPGALTTLAQPSELPQGWSEGFARKCVVPTGAPASGGMPAMASMAPPPPPPMAAKAGMASPPSPSVAPAPAPRSAPRGGAGVLGGLISRVADAFGGSGAAGPSAKDEVADRDQFADGALSLGDAFPAAELSVAMDLDDEASEAEEVVAPREAMRKRSASRFEAPKKMSKAREAKGSTDGRGVGPEAGEGVGAWLARTQGADGSFGGDVGRTAAALLLLVLDGNTRRKGLRRRTLAKAATWLAGQGGALAELALNALAAAESGPIPAPEAGWSALHGCGDEGVVLAAAHAG